MQRVRMSLMYFTQFNWEAEVVIVDEHFVDIVKDPFLLESVPKDMKVHRVSAFSKKWTSKLGLGSIALRSLWHYKKKVDDLLKNETFDLIYFSTTQFPVCVLGSYWKQKYGVPYVIDMQDPWHSDYYLTRPKSERPPKYWFSYRLNKYLEPIAMKNVDGLISVSANYIDTLKRRYPQITNVPAEVITFGAFFKDNEIARKHLRDLKPAFNAIEGTYNLVYVGRGGKDMHFALKIFFKAFKRGLEEFESLFNKFRINFVGTSYAPKGLGKKTIQPIAIELGLGDYVKEETDRIPFYNGLATLQAADGLCILGSDDPQYTASKIYPYITSDKPLISVFHPASSAVTILTNCNAGEIITFDTTEDAAFEKLKTFVESVVTKGKPSIKWTAFEPYTAKEMTKRQCRLFDRVLNNNNNS
jgi:hypothetical protein